MSGGIRYTDPDPAYTAETLYVPDYIDECEWKEITFLGGAVPGDDIDDPLEDSGV